MFYLFVGEVYKTAGEGFQVVGVVGCPDILAGEQGIPPCSAPGLEVVGTLLQRVLVDWLARLKEGDRKLLSHALPLQSTALLLWCFVKGSGGRP